MDLALAPRGAQARRPHDRTTGTESILVVDDRPGVAALAAEILADAGYRTLLAANGHEALARLAETSCDLLFTDIVMPGGMNGIVLAREARRRCEKIKVLLTTGYAEGSLEREDAGGIGFDVLSKPYGNNDLLRSVRTALDGPTGIG